MHGYWRDKSRNLIQVPSRAVHRRRPPAHPLHPLSRRADIAEATMAAAELRRLANDKAPPQRWDKELVWIYCERCAERTSDGRQELEVERRWFKFQVLDTASGRAKKKKKINKIKGGLACPSSYQSRQVFIPSGCRDPRAAFIYWASSLEHRETRAKRREFQFFPFERRSKSFFWDFPSRLSYFILVAINLKWNIRNLYDFVLRSRNRAETKFNWRQVFET